MLEKLTISERIRTSAQPLLLPLVKYLLQHGVKPNHITILCFLGFLISSILISQGKFLIAGIILLFFAPLDAIDGLLARVGNMVTTFGAFLDSTLDRYGEIFIFLAFSFYYLYLSSPAGTLLSFVALTGSLMVSYTRARAEGLGVECKVGLFTRFERVLLLVISLLLEATFLYLTVISLLTHITGLQRIIYVYKQTRIRSNMK